MDHFTYKDGSLFAEEVSIADIAAVVGTPFYCYSSATLIRHLSVFREALEGLDTTICFALKANPNIAVVSTLAAEGAGADVVSGGELRRALASGVPGNKIVFSGVGKSAAEIRLALESGVMQINVESEPELAVVSEVAQSMGLRAPVALRVNPDVDARTHAKISTGKAENKFGIEWTRAQEVYTRMANMPGVQARGLAVHIGSQLTDKTPFQDAFKRLKGLADNLRADGHGVDVLDLGGGLGVPYDASATVSPKEYGAAVAEIFAGSGYHLVFEPGRVIAGNAGILVSRVAYVKEGATRSFLIVDAAMNDLARPAMYDAYHEIVPILEPAAKAPLLPMDVVGPICETGDTFCRQRDLPPLASGDLIAFRTAGAYGAGMASTYNTRPLVPEVLVKGHGYAVVRPRMDVDALIGMERLPDWLNGRDPAMV
ncbi:MAG: diaminopimelate decarboxylase [Magnetospiraceae bacterium]